MILCSLWSSLVVFDLGVGCEDDAETDINRRYNAVIDAEMMLRER